VLSKEEVGRGGRDKDVKNETLLHSKQVTSSLLGCGSQLYKMYTIVHGDW